MKKSTVILLVTSVLAIAWTLVFYWLAGTSIVEVRNGKAPRFALAPPPADTDVCLTSAAFTSLDISGSGVMVVIGHGSLFQLKMKKHLHKEISLVLQDSTLLVRIKKISGKTLVDTLFILAPSLKSIVMYGYNKKAWGLPGLAIDSLECKELKIETERVSPVILGNCTISSMILEVNSNSSRLEMNIGSSNRFDSLLVIIPGDAYLKLGTAGVFKNNFRLSGSVQIQSPSRLLQNIKIIPIQ